jgi:hypothetical protein
MAPEIGGALLEKLGDEAAANLKDVLDAHMRESTEHIVTRCLERFDGRLVEETSKLRVEMADLRADLRSEIATLRGEFTTFRSEMREEFTAFRSEMHQDYARFRGDVRDDIHALRVDAANDRVELLKWAFLFWIGQLAGVAGVLSVLLRNAGR